MNRKDSIAHAMESSVAQLGHSDEQVREKARSILEHLILEDPVRAEAVLERLPQGASGAREDCVKLLGTLVDGYAFAK